MGGYAGRSIEIGTDTGFLGQNAGKQFVDSGVFNASSLSALGAQNEIQSIRIFGAPTGGSFRLTYGGSESTVGVPFNADTASVKAALDTITALANKVQVTGQANGPYFVHFIGAGLAGTDVGAITATTVALTGGASPGVSITEQKKGGVASGDPRFLTGSADFPTTVVTKVTHDGRQKVQEYTGTGSIFGFIDGVEEYISNSKNGDRDIAIYRHTGLVVDARKIKNYALYKTAIDAFATARSITIKHG